MFLKRGFDDGELVHILQLTLSGKNDRAVAYILNEVSHFKAAIDFKMDFGGKTKIDPVGEYRHFVSFSLLIERKYVKSGIQGKQFRI
ncbi:hypothetical protein LPTSP1_10280 [Leptospira johnsonii]|uniref:Uncharacterized protein n=1 Tax=Leptospira johnsonii TaxID=1917820 RepID=A0A2P2D063_9LEPT|nr:hypothetical protein LPTSP1_10280 [Leptospira johnsonii]